MKKRNLTLILIHGFLATWRTWTKLKPYLMLRGFRVYSPSLPYKLVSIRPDPYESAEYIYRYLSFKRIEGDVFLIGHSFGGLISKALLLRYGNVLPVRGVITLATPHMGVMWSKNIISSIYREIKGLQGNEFARFLKSSLHYIGRTFAYGSPIIDELNRAFHLKGVRFLLLGSDKAGIGSLITSAGDGVVELESQVPRRFRELENVEHFIFYNVFHTEIQKIPQSRDLIHRFIVKNSAL